MGFLSAICLSRREERKFCIVCRNDARGTTRFACGHYRCKKCVIETAVKCLRDESLYPPTCCNKLMKKDGIIGKLSGRVRKEYVLRCEELDVLPRKRVYCPRPACSAFAGSSNSAVYSHLVCRIRKCSTKICIYCKGFEHPDAPCSVLEDEETVALRELAVEKNWKPCPYCGWMIERLDSGCYETTCRCKKVFCFSCGDPNPECTSCVCPTYVKRFHVHFAGRVQEIDILLMWASSKDESIHELLRLLTTVNHSTVETEVNVPCDIQDCYKKHQVSWNVRELDHHMRRNHSSSLLVDICHLENKTELSSNELLHQKSIQESDCQR